MPYKPSSAYRAFLSKTCCIVNHYGTVCFLVIYSQYTSVQPMAMTLLIVLAISEIEDLS